MQSRSVRWLLAVSALLLMFSDVAFSVGESPLVAGRHRARVNDLELSYMVSGAGPLLFVVPGGPGLSYNVYRPFLEPLEAEATVVYVNPRGAGDSESPANGDYSVNSMAQDLEELRKLVGVERVSIFGHSHGAVVALLYSVEYPQHVDRLVLSGGAHYLGQEWLAEREQARVQHPRYPEYAALVAGGANPMELEMLLQFYDYEAQIPKLSLIAEHLGMAPEPGIYFMSHEMRGFDLRGRLNRCDMPVLLVWGEYDTVDPLPRARTLASELPNARLVVLEQSGHLCFIEKDAEFAEAVLSFLRGND